MAPLNGSCSLKQYLWGFGLGFFKIYFIFMCGIMCEPLKIKPSVLMAIEIRIKSDGHKPGRYILYLSRPLSLPCSQNNTTAPSRQHREKKAPIQPKWREINNTIYQHGHLKSNQCGSQTAQKPGERQRANSGSCGKSIPSFWGGCFMTF